MSRNGHEAWDTDRDVVRLADEARVHREECMQHPDYEKRVADAYAKYAQGGKSAQRGGQAALRKAVGAHIRAERDAGEFKDGKRWLRANREPRTRWRRWLSLCEDIDETQDS